MLQSLTACGVQVTRRIVCCPVLIAVLLVATQGKLGTLQAEEAAAGAAGYAQDVDLGFGTLLGKEEDRIWVGVGAFNVKPNNAAGRSADFVGEYHFGGKFYTIGPLLGLSVNTDGGVYGYGGIYTSLALGEVLLTPFFTVGGYAQNDSKDLGSVVQFQSGIEGAYGFDYGGRLGVRFSHISNGGVKDKNPGAEILLLSYSHPM